MEVFLNRASNSLCDLIIRIKTKGQKKSYQWIFFALFFLHFGYNSVSFPVIEEDRDVFSAGSSMVSHFLEMQHLAAMAPMDALPDSGLPFSPIRLAVMVLWAYLCVYTVQQFEFGSYVSPRFKPVINFFSFFIGPFIFFAVVVTDTVRKVQEGELEVSDIWANLWKRHRRPSGAAAERTIQLLDSAGRSFDEIYGAQGKDRDIDREILDATEKIILDALYERASDILMDPRTDGFFTVRFRIDGMLRTELEVEAVKCVAIVNSVKAIAGMDIAERRRPQDGAFMARIPEGSVHFRVASAGVLGGEKISIRVLDQSIGLMQLQDIGLSPQTYKIIANAIQQPSGMIIVCGPTGSGKTTSLYAMLSTIDFYTRNVITVEDPVEHYLAQASQIEVNVKAEITFSNALRSILRQDPDVICVGEIRDSETANMALQASQTGHLVLATLHSSSNMGTLVRLMDLGVKPLLLASAISVIVSQRLVRRLCDKCKSQAKMSEGHARRFRETGIDPESIMKANGCKACAGTGYRGRIAIMDVMTLDKTVKSHLVEGNLSLGELKRTGDEKGKATLLDEGLRKVAAGLTTLDEIKRVTSNLG